MMTDIEPIWKEYHDRLHGFIRSRVGDTSTADDILQEVFLRIHSRIDTLKESSKIKSWIYRITRNAIIDHYRARKPMEELPESLAVPETDASVKAVEAITGCVLPMIRHLPDHYRQALMLSEIKGLTQKEVARKQGVSTSGAKSRIQRGRSMIKDMLMDVCHFEFDQQGNVIDYRSKGEGCECDKN
ncbi:MAG: RNA polymerase sigma factor SigZ [Candidatus Aminicenantes bacterium]|nr:RNA polymerase sigma factor SigZ [Candidatus Aminicenantes bacterium]NIM84401.1 RNA polymerase sigma factor SigZ [Candidatus Aminicenantes bacterium]NIN23888.1 RNA polymerase sigma factor SigZ [Candidatus Aminicenantes bacterium]NIN47604.1 RNA polymerase sigma factor SigZ [Candidatus Aminicenantes bacterium]NIN90524.1 RNA polymerase sigma factor SigZ [Candidatus Aminicenantes bacterium]